MAEEQSEGTQGYVFICNKAILEECQAHRVFGAPEAEFEKMQACIAPGFLLFLFNIESLKLLGPFVAQSVPSLRIIPDAFGGKLSAQVQVGCGTNELRQVAFEKRIAAGLKPAATVGRFQAKLMEEGEPMDPEIQLLFEGDNPLAADAEEDTPQVLKEEEGEHPEEADGAEPEEEEMGVEGQEEDPYHLLEGEVDEGEEAEELQEAAGADTENAEQPEAETALDAPEEVALEEAAPEEAAPAVLAPAEAKEDLMAAVKEGASAGYVFVCNTQMQTVCQKNKLLAAPEAELDRMTSCIGPGTSLFLFNVETLALLGPFAAVGEPGCIAPGTFGHKLKAQVHVVVQDIIVYQATLPSPLRCGPKTEKEVAKFLSILEDGGAADEEAQDEWFQLAPSPMASPENDEEQLAAEEPPTKKARLSPEAAAVAATLIGNFSDRNGEAGKQQPQPQPQQQKQQWQQPKQQWQQPQQQARTGLVIPRASPGGATDIGAFVFHCNNATQQTCQRLQLFGAPDAALPDMQRCLKPGSVLLLFNIETYSLMGPYQAEGHPARAIMKDAFGGRFTAQVRAVPSQKPLRQAVFQARVAPGGKRSAEAANLLRALEQGSPLGAAGAAAAKGKGSPGGAKMISPTAPAPTMPSPGRCATWMTPPRSPGGLSPNGTAAAVQRIVPAAAAAHAAKADPTARSRTPKKAPAGKPASIAASPGRPAGAPLASNFRPAANRTTAPGIVVPKAAIGPKAGAATRSAAPSPSLRNPSAPAGVVSKPASWSQAASAGQIGKWKAAAAAAAPSSPVAAAPWRGGAGALPKPTQKAGGPVPSPRASGQPPLPAAARSRTSTPKAAGAESPRGAPVLTPGGSPWTPRGTGKPAPASKGPAPKAAIKPLARPSSTPMSPWMPQTPAGGGADGGYIFVCSQETQGKCESLKLFGAPDWELPKMQRCVEPGSTLLFLLNFETLRLFGPFVAASAPQRLIVPGAFGTRFGAHVRVRRSQEDLLEVKLAQRLGGGPQTAEQVTRLLEQLNSTGTAASASMQRAFANDFI